MKLLIKECESFSYKLFIACENYELVLEEVIQNYVDEIGLCVNIIYNDYVYTDGNENGMVIEFINYPRFPTTKEELYVHAENVGKLLLMNSTQLSCSIMGPDKTVMIYKEDKEKG